MRAFIQNDRVQIVSTENQSLPFVMALEQDAENAKYVGQWSLTQHKHALHDEDILHALIQDAAGRNVGYAIVRGLKGQHDSLELMRIVIADKGQGYGKATLSLIKKMVL